jgi:mRNA interferase RelE/StbE
VNEAAFSIRWAPTAQRDLRRLPEKIGTAVVEFIYGSLAGNPERVGRELHLQLAGHHAARRGDYRVVYRIDRRAGVVLTVHVDHRADVYRRS